jgi:hypothetical protein
MESPTTLHRSKVSELNVSNTLDLKDGNWEETRNQYMNILISHSAQSIHSQRRRSNKKKIIFAHE